MATQIPGTHFTIVGDGPERARLEQDLGAQNLYDRGAIHRCDVTGPFRDDLAPGSGVHSR